jgi:hypothetical protein
MGVTEEYRESDTWEELEGASKGDISMQVIKQVSCKDPKWMELALAL